ncbi:hypothetical protein [Jeotgalibacillus sp. R-1-5s-1]|uniref:hypothetical protein n=1 Tax=Jeotgalibacillus sp. R-1-5s-1 TaxID=2555897 RepID=UPI00106A2174|nr:hypothetical protein [Jeotgalibacillus sp. R-1-5s-1]TFD97103.1 hypothetical protein E2491_10465 [Jeotgalibacillus sp. R-1-5s-1]
MKRHLYPILITSLLITTACSDDKPVTDEQLNDSKEETATEPSVINEDLSTEEENIEIAEAENSEETAEQELPIIEEDQDIKVTTTYLDEEISISGTTGPVSYEISKVALVIYEPKNVDLADILGVEVNEEIHTLVIGMAGENSLNEDVSFYLDQATVITNTKEQLEPNFFLGDYIDGEYFGNVRHEGTNAYVLNNSTVDQIESFEIRISEPYNASLEVIGEPVSESITLE